MRWPHGHKHLPTRLTSNITTRRPRGTKHWPMTPTSNIAESWLTTKAIAKEKCCQGRTAMSAESTLTDERRRREAAERNAASAEMALAEIQHHHEAAAQTAMSAARSLANKRCRPEASKCAVALAEQVLAKEQCPHKAAGLAAMSAERSLANKQCHHEAAKQAVASVELALTEEYRCWNSLLCWQREPSPMSIVTKSWSNALQRWRSWRWQIWHCLSRRWPRISGAMRKPPKNSAGQMTSMLWPQYCGPTPLTWQSGAFGQNTLYALLLLMPSWPRLHAMTLRTMPELCQQQPCHIQRPCHHPPTALLHIRVWSFPPWGEPTCNTSRCCFVTLPINYG
jgi:hypothetical protein